MVCPFCFHVKTKVANSRRTTRHNETWRRRHCLSCDAYFTTYEKADPASVLVMQSGMKLTGFSYARLLLSVLKACDHRTDIDRAVPYIADTVTQKLYGIAARHGGSITKEYIRTTVSDTLKHYDPVAYVKYAGKHQPLDAPSIRQALKRQV